MGMGKKLDKVRAELAESHGRCEGLVAQQAEVTKVRDSLIADIMKLQSQLRLAGIEDISRLTARLEQTTFDWHAAERRAEKAEEELRILRERQEAARKRRRPAKEAIVEPEMISLIPSQPVRTVLAFARGPTRPVVTAKGTVVRKVG